MTANKRLWHHFKASVKDLSSALVGGVHQEAPGQHRGVEDQGQRPPGSARRHQGQVPRPGEGTQGWQHLTSSFISIIRCRRLIYRGKVATCDEICRNQNDFGLTQELCSLCHKAHLLPQTETLLELVSIAF